MVELDEPLAGALHPPRLGRIATNSADVPASITGYASWAQDHWGADTWQLNGFISAGGRVNSDRYVFTLKGTPPTTGWDGLSGAPLWSHGLLTGVVLAEQVGGGHGYLVAVPLYALCLSDDAKQILRKHGVDCTLHPVELEAIAEHEPISGGSPAGLLRAGRETVPFRGREQVLADLLAWARADTPLSAHLIHASGGQGKTRLAKELSRRLEAERWATLWLSPAAGNEQLDVLARVSIPLLIVIDYAENRPKQITEVLRVLARRVPGQRQRLLLLARTNGDWWKGLASESAAGEEFLRDAGVHALPLLEQRADGQIAAYREALHGLAEGLSDLPGQQAFPWQAILAKLGSGEAVPSAATSILAIHLAALADLMDEAYAVAVDASAPLEARVLAHEERYWRMRARALSLPLPEAEMADAVAVSQLLGANTAEEANTVLDAFGSRNGSDARTGSNILRWLSSIYPGVDGAPWGNLEPDRLAEFAAGERLKENPQLIDSVLPTISPSQARRLLSTYARAAEHPSLTDPLSSQLTTAVVRHKDILAVPAVEVVPRLHVPQPLKRAIRIIVEDQATPSSLLESMVDEDASGSDFEEETLLLLREVVRRARRDSSPRLPKYLAHLAGQLGLRGETDEALPLIDEGAKALLASDSPDTATLLALLGVYSQVLAGHGRLDESRQSALLAVQLLQARPELAAGEPAVVASLAAAHVTLGLRWVEAGDQAQALAHTLTGVNLLKPLAEAEPGGLYEVVYAGAVLASSLRYAATGHVKEAVERGKEAVDIHRRLAEDRRDYREFMLANALVQYAMRLMLATRFAEAREAATEALDIHQRLAEHGHPQPQQLIEALLQVVSLAGEEPETVLPLATRAVKELESLARRNPANTRPLAQACAALAHIYREAGNVEAALKAASRAINIIYGGPRPYTTGLLQILLSALQVRAQLQREHSIGDGGLRAGREAIQAFQQFGDTPPTESHLEILLFAQSHARALAEQGLWAEWITVLRFILETAKKFQAQGPGDTGMVLRARLQLAVALIWVDEPRTSLAELTTIPPLSNSFGQPHPEAALIGALLCVRGYCKSRLRLPGAHDDSHRGLGALSSYTLYDPLVDMARDLGRQVS